MRRAPDLNPVVITTPHRVPSLPKVSLPYLEPGERVRSLARSQTFHPLWMFSYVPFVFVESFHRSRWPFVLILFILVVIVLGRKVLKKYKVGRIVVITDRRVLVRATTGQ